MRSFATSTVASSTIHEKTHLLKRHKIKAHMFRDSITPAEKKLFHVLEFIRKKYVPDATLRVAGGWVRDKLLGLESDDIDIALDILTGEQFTKVNIIFRADHDDDGDDHEDGADEQL